MDLEQEAPLEERVGQIEIELQRALEEVEACSVLVLSLDGVSLGTASGSAAGRRLETDSEETLRLKARIDVLEEAWALRSTTVGQRAEESIARVEEEVKKIWRELLSKERNPSKESGHVEARLIEDLKQRLEKTQSQVAELNALKPEDVDSLMKKMIDEVGHSVKLLGDRCSKLEVELATMQATDVSSQADRERTEQLEKMVDLLLQQRRQDLQESQANFREVEARFLDLDQRDHAEKSWRQEAEAIRKEIQEVRSTHVPSLFQQHMKAMKAMQEGLAAVRAEVKKLSEVVEAVQASSTPRAEAQADGSSREVLALKAQVSDLQEQVTLLVVRGLEERFANLRADVSREVTAAVRETKENWAVASRRLSALEAWPQAELSAEMQSMRSERLEDYMVAQVYGETIEKEMKHFKRIREEQLAKKRAQEEALGIAAKNILTQPKHKSCQVSQLEQSLGHFPNPHPHDGKPRVQSDPQKILRFGVTGEGQGRGAYLKLEKTKGGPIERYGRALTTAQEIGWTAGPATKTYTSSPFAHRPLIQSQFYRPMGVSFSTGAL